MASAPSWCTCPAGWRSARPTCSAPCRATFLCTPSSASPAIRRSTSSPPTCSPRWPARSEPTHLPGPTASPAPSPPGWCGRRTPPRRRPSPSARSWPPSGAPTAALPSARSASPWSTACATRGPTSCTPPSRPPRCPTTPGPPPPWPRASRAGWPAPCWPSPPTGSAGPTSPCCGGRAPSSTPSRGHLVPTSWDAVARAAGVRDGVDEWHQRIALARANRVSFLESRSEASHGEPFDPGDTPGGLDWRVARLDELDAHISWLAQHLQPPDEPTWAAWAGWLGGLLDELLGASVARREPSADAAARVSSVVASLAHLDGVEPPPDLDRLRRVLEPELDRPDHGHGRFGHGVLVGRLVDVVGADLDLVVVVGASDGELPPHRREDPLLPDCRPRAGRRPAGAAEPPPRRGAPRPAGGAGLGAHGGPARPPGRAPPAARAPAGRLVHRGRLRARRPAGRRTGPRLAGRRALVPPGGLLRAGHRHARHPRSSSTSPTSSPTTVPAACTTARWPRPGLGWPVASLRLAHDSRAASTSSRAGSAPIPPWCGRSTAPSPPPASRPTPPARSATCCARCSASAPSTTPPAPRRSRRWTRAPSSTRCSSASSKGRSASHRTSRGPTADHQRLQDTLTQVAARYEAEGLTGRPLLWGVRLDEIRHQLRRALEEDDVLRAAVGRRPHCGGADVRRRGHPARRPHHQRRAGHHLQGQHRPRRPFSRRAQRWRSTTTRRAERRPSTSSATPSRPATSPRRARSSSCRSTPSPPARPTPAPTRSRPTTGSSAVR